MGQTLLFPDPKPLDQRLGRKFFRKVPRRPGVYLMKDASDKVLYVGKAKDLKQRLNHYRVANPDRMPRRHLRMVREVARIEFQFCANEAAALKHESRLLRSLKPKFNRAGVWPGKPRFMAWRVNGAQLEMTVFETPETGWQRYGPMGSNAFQLHRAMARLLWLAVNQGRGIAELPAGWVHGRFMDRALIHCGESVGEVAAQLESFFWGKPDQFISWLGSKFTERTGSFDWDVIGSELETLEEISAKVLLLLNE
jgi:predicted GIY-YIG superfamily endonuclease